MLLELPTSSNISLFQGLPDRLLHAGIPLQHISGESHPVLFKMPAATGVPKSLLSKQEKAQERAIKASQKAEEALKKALDAAAKAAAAQKQVRLESRASCFHLVPLPKL